MKTKTTRFSILVPLLTLLAAGRALAANADLSAKLNASQTTVTQGSNVVVTATVSNAGPSSASGVVASVHLPGFTVT